MNARKKRLLTTIVSVVSLLILSLAGFIYVHYNLLTYQTYYAKQMPHAEGTNPEMVLLLENLDWLRLPDVEGIEYQVDSGNNNVTKDDNILIVYYSDGPQISFLKPSSDIKFKNDSYRMYLFSKSGKFGKYYYRDKISLKDVYDNSEERKQEAQAYIDEVIDPIVDKMYKKPSINLQWLFNWKYEKRFSGD